MKKRIFLCCTGVFLFSFGSSICNICQLGVDPWTSLNTGISSLSGLSTGTCSIIMQAILAIIIFYLSRDFLNLGTFINIAGFGIVFDISTAFLQKLPFINNITMIERFFLLFLGIMLFTLGLSIYSGGSLGLSPYDASSRTLCRYFKLPYSASRILTDGICILFAFITGGSIGIGTIITVFLAGPFVQFWDGQIISKLRFAY